MSKIDILGFGLQKADKKISNFDLEKKLIQVMNGLSKGQVFRHATSVKIKTPVN